MKHTTTMFDGFGEVSLFAQSWLPEEPLRGILGIVHGIGEHSDRYQNIVEPLVKNHFGVWAFDLRGHGRSGGRKGHIHSWVEYRDDVRYFLSLIQDHHPGLPLTLYGHSLGSLIVMESLMRDPSDWTAGILSGVPIEPAGVASPLLKMIARIMTKLWPSFAIDVGIDPAGLSRDPSVVNAYVEDPMVHKKGTARWGTEALDAIEWVKANARRLQIPLLMLHGEADPVNTVNGARSFYEQVGSQKKDLKVYPGSLHEVHNDLDHPEVASDIREWLGRYA